jgi:Alginate export
VGQLFHHSGPDYATSHADLYFIGLDTKSVSYNRGTAREIRHTAGARAFCPIGKGLDYNWEGNLQWGAFGNNSIRAWSASTETGYTFDHVRFQSRPYSERMCTVVMAAPPATLLERSTLFFPVASISRRRRSRQWVRKT